MNDGRLLFARYAFMPNHLGFCGGPESLPLLEYCVEDQADLGLNELITQFQAAYPYLKFIANSNGLADPMDPRVVEAYWIGNGLLDNVRAQDFHAFLTERFAPRIPERLRKYVVSKPPQGARPHHSFHVLDVSMRTGALKESVDVLDRCRISWGVVDRVEGDVVRVQYQPLVLMDGKLALGERAPREVQRQVQGKGYLTDLALGDLVTMHWGWVCDRVTPRQARRLEVATRYHMGLANATL